MTRRRTARIAAKSVACLLLGILIVWQLSRSLPTPALLDFGSFWESGAAATRGDDPYGVYPLTFHVVMPGFESRNPNLNPPVALPLFQLFAALPPHVAFRHWWALSAVLYGLLVAGLLAARRRADPDAPLLLPALWAVALAGFWDTLVLGQIYVPLAGLAAAGWLLLKADRPLPAGVSIGLLAAVKPNFLVWPVLLVLAGQRRSGAVALATVAVAWGAAFAAYGVDVHRDWLAALAGEPERLGFLTNVSLAGLLQRLGGGSWGSIAGLATLPLLALLVIRMRPGPLDASALGLVGALVASPIAWVHYMLCLLPLFIDRPRDRLLAAAAVLLLVPVPLVLDLSDASPLVQGTLGSVHTWALFVCCAASLRSLFGESPGLASERAGRTERPDALTPATGR